MECEREGVTRALEYLHGAGLKVTQQRLALVTLLLNRGDGHVTPEELYHEARGAGIALAKATVYNTLHAFAERGLVRQIVVDAERTYFDTNTDHCCHLYCEDTGKLHHLREDMPALKELFRQLGGMSTRRVDVLIRVRPYDLRKGRPG